MEAGVLTFERYIEDYILPAREAKVHFHVPRLTLFSSNLIEFV